MNDNPSIGTIPEPPTENDNEINSFREDGSSFCKVVSYHA